MARANVASRVVIVESWVVAILFVGAVTLAVLRVAQRVIRADERRDDDNAGG